MACCLLAAATAWGQDDPALALSTYAEGFDQPVALAMAPDGRMFVAEKEGHVRLIDPDGTVRETPFATFEVYAESECGLLNVALGPDFAGTRYVYFFLTATPDEQRIVRMTDVDGVGTDLTVIRDSLPTNGGVHNGGGLAFGPDGKLYFSIGDNGVPQNADDFTTFAGKVCRIDADGSTPTDNPFTTPTGTPRAIYALGFRNPFRMCFASDGRLFVTDVGSSGLRRREEVNEIVAGGNYGWPGGEGVNPPGNDFVDPIVAYRQGGSSITGCAVYEGDTFPLAYHGTVLHVDYVSNRLFRIVLGADPVHESVLELDGGPVDLIVGQDGNLYFPELFTGRIRRISSTEPPPDGQAPAGDVPPTDGGGGTVATPPACGAGTVAFLAPVLVALFVQRTGRVRRRRYCDRW